MKIAAFIIFSILLSGCSHDHGDHDGHNHSGKDAAVTQHHNEHREEAEDVHFSKEKQDVVKVEMTNSKTSEMLEKISVPGIVKADPRYSFTVSSTSRGIFSYSTASELIYEGKFVKKEEILAVIYPVAQQEHWTQIEQAHNLAIVEKEFAQKEYERVKDLSEKGVVSEKELLIVKNNAETASQNLKSAKERIFLLHGGKGKSIQIKTPVSGILRKIFVKSGTLAEPGESLFEVVAPEKLVIYGEILKGDIPSG